MRAVMNRRHVHPEHRLPCGATCRTDFPTATHRLHNYFVRCMRWRVDRIHHALRRMPPTAQREASPTACIIDSQSVKQRQRRAHIDPHGFDAGKLIKGNESGIFSSIRWVCCCTPSFIPPYSGSRRRHVVAWRRCSVTFPFLQKLSPTAPIKGHSSTTHSPKSCPVSKPKSSNDPRSQGVRTTARALDRRRTIAWLSRCRRLAKTGKISTAAPSRSSKLASIRLMAKTL